MNRYELQGHLGDGTYGHVLKAVKRGTGEVVAIKKLKKKFGTFGECLDLREVRTLRDLSHPSIVRLIEVIRENDSTLFFVFEHMEANLYELMKRYQSEFCSPQKRFRLMGGGLSPTIIPETTIRSILSQVLQALAFMCERGYFHRDIKPENILVKNDVVKIADLGLAREIRSLPPYTDYVSTRWYRAPEVLLRSSYYNSPIDIFAVGCILAELYALHPLFPGSSEIDQIYLIFRLLGPPTVDSWPEGVSLVHSMQISPLSNVNQQQFSIPFPQGYIPEPPNDVNMRLLSAIPQMKHRIEAIDLLEKMLTLNPKGRISAKNALEHPFFKAELGHVPSNFDDHGSQMQKLLIQHQHASFHGTGVNTSVPILLDPIQQRIDESKNYFSESLTNSFDRLSGPLHNYCGIHSSILPHGTSLAHDCNQSLCPNSGFAMLPSMQLQTFIPSAQRFSLEGLPLSCNQQNFMDTSLSMFGGGNMIFHGRENSTGKFHVPGVIPTMLQHNVRVAPLGGGETSSERDFCQKKL